MMMRVFESLGCRVMDEPFYAYWLAATQKTDDPGYKATLAAHETDWRVVANMSSTPISARAIAAIKSTWRSTC